MSAELQGSTSMNKSFIYALLTAILLISINCYSQTIPASRLTNWSQAGYPDTLPVFSNTINIMNHGGVSDGSTANDNAILAAISALNGQPGTIYFPPGDYLFTNTINISRDSLVFKGDDVSSRLLFNMNGNLNNSINITGSFSSAGYSLNKTAYKNEDYIITDNPQNASPGDHIYVNEEDPQLVYSAWAYQGLGQIVEIKSKSNDTLYLKQKLRRTYTKSAKTKIQKLAAPRDVGFECLYIERRDATSQQTNNIDFNKAINCWVLGVESNKSNFSHVSISYSSHILVRGCYFHHAHAYGGGGQAYGTTIQYGSGDCLVENNIFEHLRHSMLVQAGANGNVISYNYSFDPYWDQSPLPTDAGGDLVCHGNYPFLNLFEGNIAQSIVVDDSHGINGPFNTFFRNRADLYGIYMNSNPPTDSTNFAGNEITNTGSLKGNYVIVGTGNFEHANNIKSVITPSGSGNLSEQSLYLTSPPPYWSGKKAFPSVGPPVQYNVGSNTAKDRYTSTATDCERNPKYVSASTIEPATNAAAVLPNPFNNKLHIISNTEGSYELYDIRGVIALSGNFNKQKTEINTSTLPDGIYILNYRDNKGNHERIKLIKIR